MGEWREAYGYIIGQPPIWDLIEDLEELTAGIEAAKAGTWCTHHRGWSRTGGDSVLVRCSCGRPIAAIEAARPAHAAPPVDVGPLTPAGLEIVALATSTRAAEFSVPLDEVES